MVWFGGVWFDLVVGVGGLVVYSAVAIAPISAISKQYIIIGAINISISSTC